MRLPKGVYGAVDLKKIKVYRADRGMTRYWNDQRGANDLRYFCGWYWYEESKGKAASAEHGPFHSRSAAYRDAFVALGLIPATAEQKTTQITGSNIVQMPKKATTSPQGRHLAREGRSLQRKLARIGVR